MSALIASWDAASHRWDGIDPQGARYASDLGNGSFATGSVVTGSIAHFAGAIMVSPGNLPNGLGWWAILAGLGQVLARGTWTHGVAIAPSAAYWAGMANVSVLPVLGQLAIAEDER